MNYWTKSPGTGGSVVSEEDFVVEEIPLKKFLVKFQRSSSGVTPVTGPYSLYLLKKRGLTTKEALGIIAKKYSLNRKDIGYAGLKDKFAATTQYITIKGKAESFKDENIELSFIMPCQPFMSVGELEGNNFCITLRNCKKPENIQKIISELEKRGMPNYFGAQRFGVHKDNDRIGLLLLKREFNDALALINRNYHKDYRSVRAIDKKILKFFIHSYQSSIFNRVLDSYIAKNSKPLFDNIPLVGFGTKLRNDFAGHETKKILDSDSIGPESFRLDNLGMACTGGMRPAFVDVKNIKYIAGSNIISLEFFLPKGSYATVLVREVVKDGRI
jgi:tRNA(Glu) U13 pseudouridine synthase TruD